MNSASFSAKNGLSITICAAVVTLLLQLFLITGAAAEERETINRSDPAFVGTWISELDGSVLKLTQTSFYYKFGYKGGVRENSGPILAYDTDKGHITLKYSQVLQDGVEIDGYKDTLYMTYRVDGDILRKMISPEGFPPEPQSERLKKRVQ